MSATLLRPHHIDENVIELLEFFPRVVAQFVDQGEVWATSGYRVLRRRARSPWDRVGRVPSSLGQKLSTQLPWIQQGLRLGIHHLLRLRSGTVLATVNGELMRSVDGGRSFSPTHPFDNFRKPPRGGVVEDPDGRIFLAEYTLDWTRSRSIRVWRSDDDGIRFEEIFRFQPGEVRHIHFLQIDPVDLSLWMGTGDDDDEAGIYRSTDGGSSFSCVGKGQQNWRAIGVAFGEDAVFWGTDAGRDKKEFENRILRWDREAMKLSEVGKVQGPVHGIVQLPNHGFLLGTGIEDGHNETDGRAHLWYSSDGLDWADIASFNRGVQPRKVGYGVIHFLEKQADVPEIYLTLRGLEGCALGTVVLRIRR